jgi:hypothetical protein
MKQALWALTLAASALPATIGLIAPAMAQEDAPEAKPATPADYAAIAKLPDWTGVWQPDWGGLFGRPQNTPPVLTPAAKTAQDAFNARKEHGENLQTEAANCRPSGMPGIMRQPYPIEFLYSPGRVTILHETYSQARRIYTDGRPLPEDPDPAFNGWSVGHWEGDTLIVETIGLNEQNTIMESMHATPQTRIKERFHITQPDVLTVETEITDPALFVGAYQVKTNYMRRRDWQIREYVCEENNRDKADEQGRPSLDLSK